LWEKIGEKWNNKFCEKRNIDNVFYLLLLYNDVDFYLKLVFSLSFSLIYVEKSLKEV